MKYFAPLILFVVAVFLIGFVSSTNTNSIATCRMYDNFNSGELDLNKWFERTWHDRPFTDEHYVDSTEGRYHVAQHNRWDAETNLGFTREFNPGDLLFYEVYYNSGDGNHMTQPLVNGNYPPESEEECPNRNAGCGTIGYWNGEPHLGTQIGKYKVKFEFLDDKIRARFTRPDGTSEIYNWIGFSDPYVIEFNTHTGHNGILHMDYDNIIVCTN